ncbi:MAG: hypothetical protein ACQETO_05980 [Pseudomonadota bacterium]
MSYPDTTRPQGRPFFSHDRVVITVSGLALVAALVMLNRWMVTEQGVQSFGRLWHYYLSYTDFGFSRRALTGTVLGETGINRLIDDPYLFAYLFYAAKLILLAGLVTYWCLRHRIFRNPLWYTLVFLSPAFLLQGSYVTGSQDLQLLILATVLVLFVHNRYLLMIGALVGVLMHELFLFLLPLILLIHFLERRHQGESLAMVLSQLALVALPAGLAAVVVIFMGDLEVARQTYDQLMAQRTPGSAFPTGNGSGYFEVTASMEDNLSEGVRTLERIRQSLPWPFLPLAYALLLIMTLTASLHSLSGRLRTLLALCCLMPLLVTFVAADVYRWIGMSANLALLALLYFGSRQPLQPPRLAGSALLVFCLLAPFGSADISRPLPAHQLLWERLAGE